MCLLQSPTHQLSTFATQTHAVTAVSVPRTHHLSFALVNLVSLAPHVPHSLNKPCRQSQIHALKINAITVVLVCLTYTTTDIHAYAPRVMKELGAKILNKALMPACRVHVTMELVCQMPRQTAILVCVKQDILDL